jgi:hypothetical protein
MQMKRLRGTAGHCCKHRPGRLAAPISQAVCFACKIIDVLRGACDAMESSRRCR